MRLNRKTSFAIGVVVALVLGSGTAFAATGGSFILGKSNKAGAITKLTNPKGTALALNSRAGAPPLRVNRPVKVPNLNADRLDGLDQSAFARAAGAVGAYDVGAQAMDEDGNGYPEVVFAFATCPPGSKRTGGGGFDGTASGTTFWNAPAEGNSWIFAVVTDNYTPESPADTHASVVCYNPRGSMKYSYRTAPPRTPDEVLEKLRAKAAAATR